MAMRTWALGGTLVSLIFTGCVSTGQYRRREAELQGQAAAQDAEAKQREADLKSQIEALRERVKGLEGQLSQTGADRDKLRAQLDDTTATLGQLRQRLEKLGQNVDKLTGERGQLSAGLADAKARLEALRRQEAAVEAQAKTFRELLARLRTMIDAGKLKVIIRNGRMLIALPNDVLFDSGKVKIKPDGRAALAQVAQVLATIPDRDFLVAGDTDNVPIHTEHFPSNWELSTARAVEVVEFLIANGMKPEKLGATGYGEFDPVMPNDTPEHRAQNRRIEIVLQPNLAELPDFSAALGATATPAPSP